MAGGADVPGGEDRGWVRGLPRLSAAGPDSPSVSAAPAVSSSCLRPTLPAPGPRVALTVGEGGPRGGCACVCVCGSGTRAMRRAVGERAGEELGGRKG